jgi:hypothetical protein
MTASSTNNASDIVLAVCDIAHDENGNAVAKDSQLVGTCFLIGSRGYALTAAHVLKQVNSELARVLVPDPTNRASAWDACLIREGEIPPTEDVGILKIDLPRPITSPIFFPANEPAPGQEYHMWGYPEVIAEEIKFHGLPPNSFKFKPSIVYFRGYIRRKLPYSPNPSFDMFVGNHFYEISEIGGSCCSGSPLSTTLERPETFALYIGEAQAERRCAYAANLMRVLDWSPNILGKPIRHEIGATS